MAPSKPRPSRTQRLLDLIAYLSSRRFPVPVEAIMSDVPGYALEPDADRKARETVRRRFERDKADLRDLGVPLESVRETVRGEEDVRYLLRPQSFYMPVMKLLASGDGERRGELAVRPEELRTAVEALLHVQELPAFPFRREARSTLAKLTFDLAAELLPPGGSRVRHLPPFDPTEVEAVLEIVSQALQRRKTLRFDYYAIGHDRTDRRATHPLGLLYQGSRWYLVARDLDRDGERVFRVERMSAVEMDRSSPRTPDFEMEKGQSLAKYRDRKAWDLGEPGSETEVRVRFRPPLSLLAERNAWGEPVEEPPGETSGRERDGEGGIVRRFHVRSVEPFLRWLLTHHGSTRIEAPVELRKRLNALRDRVLAAHEGPGTPAGGREAASTGSQDPGDRPDGGDAPSGRRTTAVPREGGTPSIERLLRLLHLIPAATRPGGAAYAEVAERLGVDAATIERDVREIIDRSRYLGPGDAGALQAEVGPERVEIWTPGPFGRPPRLRREEALALVLGVRSLALLRGRPPDDVARRLLDRLEGILGAESAPDPGALPIEDASADRSGGRLRDLALDAASGFRTVRLLYLKPGDEAASWRRLEPSAVVHAEGHWYVVGHEPDAGGVRAFRMDRVLELEETGETFVERPPPELPAPGAEARVYFPPEDVREVGVVYSPAIARWIRERHDGELLEDGSFRVVHEVADPDWLVRHVLQYAGEARAEGVGAQWVRARLEARGDPVSG
jgi:predicted DNA-binding transcriptional regulator YafY